MRNATLHSGHDENEHYVLVFLSELLMLCENRFCDVLFVTIQLGLENLGIAVRSATLHIGHDENEYYALVFISELLMFCENLSKVFLFVTIQLGL